MSEVVLGKKSDSFAFFCPQCACPSVTPKDTSFLVEPSNVPYACTACPWQGPKKELATAPIKHEFTSDEEIVQTMLRDLRTLLASGTAVVYAKFLIKWGFLDSVPKKEQLARYIAAIARSNLTAIIEERRKMVEEAARARATAGG